MKKQIKLLYKETYRSQNFRYDETFTFLIFKKHKCFSQILLKVKASEYESIFN